MNTYTIGTEIFLTANFSNGDNPTAPSVITCKIKLPNNKIIDLSSNLSTPATGVYVTTFVPSWIGIYTYEWIASGNVNIVANGQLEVIGEMF